MTRETPYQRLLKAVREFVSRAEHPPRTTMWLYPKDNLGAHWSLTELYERTAAADQIGHDVRLVAAPDGLRVEYVKRPAEIDYGIW